MNLLPKHLVDLINRHLPDHLWLADNSYLHHLEYLHDPETGHPLPHVIGEIMYLAQENRLLFKAISQPMHMALEEYMSEVSYSVEAFLEELLKLMT